MGRLRVVFLTPVLALVIVVAVVTSTEVILRNQHVRAYLPPPSVGSRSRWFEQHLEQLAAFGKKGKRLDCIILGSSMPLAGIDPDVLSATYAERTGVRLDCYDLALPGMRAASAGALGNLLIEDYGPWLILYATTARDVVIRASSAGLEETPWIQYRSGRFSLDGWLIDHLQTYRYFKLFQSWADPTRRAAVEMRFDMSPVGFAARTPETKRRELLERFASSRLRVDEKLKAGVSERHMRGLVELLALHGSRAQVVILEMPLYPAFARSLAEDSEDYGRIMKRIGAEAERVGAPFWQTVPLQLVPGTGWMDQWHMSAEGAAVFSRWLGERLADAVEAGELQPPRSK